MSSVGCYSVRQFAASLTGNKPARTISSTKSLVAEKDDSNSEIAHADSVREDDFVRQTSLALDAETSDPAIASSPSDLELPSPSPEPLRLDTVIQSVYMSYPLLQMAFYGRTVAAGEQLSAEGAWDLKLQAHANNAPLGYYKTYRNGVNFSQPLYGGGEVFGGYKIGQGNFESWYGNRQTNQGGEFSGGVTFPLAQNRVIDERRASLWKSNYGVSAVEPVIQAQIIEFIRAGTYAYWDWVAAGLNLRITQELLELAMEREDQIEEQVKAGSRPESLLIDNRRLIVSREVKLIAAQQKVRSAAIKLSLFLRTPEGQPTIPGEERLPTNFPVVVPIDMNKTEQAVAEARSRRPELLELDLQRRMAEIDLDQARNLTRPELDGTLWSAQDVGGLTPPNGSKAPFQAEAGMSFNVPLQRRKAYGKIASVEAKITQIALKRRFAEDKISTEVQQALIAIDAAFRSISKANESVELNREMQRLEELTIEKGASDLLLLNVREASTFDARLTELDALLNYFESQADYRAATALDVSEFNMIPN